MHIKVVAYVGCFGCQCGFRRTPAKFRIVRDRTRPSCIYIYTYVYVGCLFGFRPTYGHRLVYWMPIWGSHNSELSVPACTNTDTYSWIHIHMGIDIYIGCLSGVRTTRNFPSPPAAARVKICMSFCWNSILGLDLGFDHVYNVVSPNFKLLVNMYTGNFRNSECQHNRLCKKKITHLAHTC